MQPIKPEILPEILILIGEIDEFKGGWRAYQNLAPERLEALRRVATVESVASSTRIEGVKLTDREVEHLLQNLEQRQFSTRDEQEVAGYADVMQLLFESYTSIPLTENHIKQLH
ncbi:MAG: Fic family protein, partial [Thiothrix litoralis]